MDKKTNMSSDKQSINSDKSQVRGTSGGEMPDANQNRKGTNQSDVDSAFKNSNTKDSFRK